MLDGAMLQVPPVKPAEPVNRLGSRDSSFAKQSNDFAKQDKDDFKKNLDSKMEKRDSKQSMAPEKQRDSRSEIAPKEVRKNQPEKVARQKSEVTKEAVQKNPEKQEKDVMQAMNSQFAAIQNPQIPMMPVEQVPETEVGAENIEAMKMSLLQWNQAKERHPVLKFMDSMESELGIEPDRLIAAFGALNNKELMQSPENSTEAYIQALKLSPQGEDRAKDLYSKLLTDLRIQKSNQQDTTKLIPLEVQSLLTEMNTGENKAIEFNPANRVEDMTKKFFEVYPNRFGRPVEGQQQASGLQAVEPMQLMGKAQNQNFAEINSQQNGEEDAAIMPANLQAKAQDQSTESALNKLALLGLVGAGAGAAAGQATEAGGEADVPDWMSKLSKVESQVNPEQDTNTLESFSEGRSEGGESFEGSNSENFFPGTGPAKVQTGPKFTEVSAAAAATGAEVTDGAGEGEGVESIVKNVNLLTKKGGGEMKLQLNQEGLGDMQLKVAVNEGKVNIQMITESKEAKQALESDLGALKVELGEKKIDLSEIKVEVSKDIRDQLQDQLNDRRREETMQFWKQFREENEANRSMAINRGLPSYSQRNEPTDVIADEQEASYRANRALNGGLNIVA